VAPMREAFGRATTVCVRGGSLKLKSSNVGGDPSIKQLQRKSVEDLDHGILL